MTNEEANKEAVERIERNICNHMDLCRWVDCEKCAVGLAIKALEKADKYRWHDLRKNPDDLPEADEYGCSECVLAVTGTPEWSDYEWAYYNHNTMMWSTPFCVRNVCAWRYVEPFEENKDDE